MIIYTYHPETSELIGEGVADPDPLTPGNWLTPAYSTTIEPPEKEDVKALIFVGGSWQAVTDYRGTNYWDEDGTLHTIKALGVGLPTGALLSAPVIPPTIEEQTVLSNAECTSRINAHWDQIGQINASLGIYGEEDTVACTAWIASNRKALASLLARDDVVDIDVTDDQYWPVFE